ncbi:hypothetical protein ATANTOWER_028068 [Ataeniobius toweri]|uniref:Uncharacterized protein n=1 Tax=Ataeniobius toweri TaxID=208326 RepID=A0ABU7CD18_9TELE|nr:hypothetical protein [Ataeniobius toweri]
MVSPAVMFLIGSLQVRKLSKAEKKNHHQLHLLQLRTSFILLIRNIHISSSPAFSSFKGEAMGDKYGTSGRTSEKVKCLSCGQDGSRREIQTALKESFLLRTI